MTDTERNTKLIAQLMRVSPASNLERFTDLCEEYDYEEDDVTFFFEPKPGDRLLTSMMLDPVDVVVLTSKGTVAYIGDNTLFVEDESADVVIGDLSLYRLVH